MIRRLAIFSTLLIACAPVPAFALCFEPSAPYCASSYGDFEDQNEFENCRREMQSYEQEVQSFFDCRKRQFDDVVEEADRERQQAIGEADRDRQNKVDEESSDAKRDSQNVSDAYSDAVSSFNSRAN